MRCFFSLVLAPWLQLGASRCGMQQVLLHSASPPRNAPPPRRMPRRRRYEWRRASSTNYLRTRTRCASRSWSKAPAPTRRPSHRRHLHAIDATHDAAHAGKLPIAVSFITFQKLEKDCGDDFMGAAIEYAETYKDAKDLVKLVRRAASVRPSSSATPSRGRRADGVSSHRRCSARATAAARTSRRGTTSARSRTSRRPLRSSTPSSSCCRSRRCVDVELLLASSSIRLSGASICPKFNNLKERS